MTTREFHLKEGTSDKFWKITLDGKSHTVQFGRRGTQGQAQTKDFASEGEAARSYEKLVAEKVKKGYLETTSGETTAAPPAAPKAPTATTATTAPKAATELKSAPPPAPAPAVAPSAAPAGVSVPPAGEETPRIDLDSSDWALATWRSLEPPAPPPAAPFDLAACAAKLRKLRMGSYGWQAEWHGVGLPAAMSRAEANFWFVAMRGVTKDVDVAALAASMENRSFDGNVTMDDARTFLKRGGRFVAVEAIHPLRHLLTGGELVSLLLDDAIHGKGYEYNTALLEGVRRHVVPSLSVDEVARAREMLRPRVTPALWPSDLYACTPDFQLAAALGMHDEIRAVVESWPDSVYTGQDWTDHYHQPQMVIYGLGDPVLVERHMRRMHLRLKKPLHARGWLAHTEASALDLLKESVVGLTNKEEAEALMEVFRLVHAPEAAAPMLEIHRKSKVPKAARAWFDENAAHAARGLVPVAAVRGGLSEAAVELLRELVRDGQAEVVEGAARQLSGEQAARVRAEVIEHREAAHPVLDDATTPPWLARGVAAAKARKAPAWVSPRDLPPLLVDGGRLSEAQVAAVFAALASSTLDAPHELLQGLRAHADPGSRDAFAWKLFERWLAEGAPSKEKWGMTALGFLGGDATVMKLTPMVRAWPGESQHPRAVLGLEVLRAIGSDAALMQLNGISQKLKFQGLKVRARELMEAIAKDKGLSRVELEDRVVPDCELDERGRRLLDFGPRRFQFVLGPEMKPMVRDEAGKLRDNLPEPGAKDDAATAAQAVSEWKLMKKQIKEVAKIQADRLEQALITGRRWKAADFLALVVRHPLLTHLARLLLWGLYVEKRLAGCFRVTEDQEVVDRADEPFALPADAMVGLVHPLDLPEGDRAAWGQVFSDYAIVPPFPQLGRAVHVLEKPEEKETILERYDGLKLPAPTLVFTLEKLGWVRGVGMDGGGFDEHSRQFPDADLTAVIHYEGAVSMGYIVPEEELTLRGCHFVAGLRQRSGYDAPDASALPLGKVDPIVVSETIHALEVLAAKGKR